MVHSGQSKTFLGESPRNCFAPNSAALPYTTSATGSMIKHWNQYRVNIQYSWSSIWAACFFNISCSCLRVPRIAAYWAFIFNQQLNWQSVDMQAQSGDISRAEIRWDCSGESRWPWCPSLIRIHMSSYYLSVGVHMWDEDKGAPNVSHFNLLQDAAWFWAQEIIFYGNWARNYKNSESGQWIWAENRAILVKMSVGQDIMPSWMPHVELARSKWSKVSIPARQKHFHLLPLCIAGLGHFVWWY